MGEENLEVPKKEPKKDPEKEPIGLTAPPKTKVTPTEEVVTTLTTAHEEEEAKKKQSVLVQSADMDRLLKNYREFCQNRKPPIEVDENKLKPDKDGKVSLDFKSPEDMNAFFKERAAANDRFVIIDAKTNQVLAFSNGDKEIYRPGKPPDGKPRKLEEGESILPKKEEMGNLPKYDDKFKMPEPSETSSKKLDIK
ncbi:substrate of the Dot/Icm secretion system [Legionella gratiana]|uniref:Dot/Icm secretion system substrate n=1 Tax=Legionella gratiana TaxID=45066 RepID=A0A378J8L6_9GAMM|nr:hypothetical protein [Legionella gratiana]KTD11669.1 substrate of the Dot/Icm secretion system [Legionella gratiana]STX40890.1 Dot/Icm secretion system substrate [Legionella gratiana]